jgi:hypothetical protein
MKSFQQFNEDLEARRQQLAQRQRDNATAFKEKSAASVSAHKERIASQKEAQQEKINKQKEREQIKNEVRRELQTEQSPSMGEPTEYNKQIAQQSATWKGRQIRQSHGEMQSKAGAELAAKDRRMKSIMSR